MPGGVHEYLIPFSLQQQIMVLMTGTMRMETHMNGSRREYATNLSQYSYNFDPFFFFLSIKVERNNAVCKFVSK